jgi:uncharacterized protein YqeY
VDKRNKQIMTIQENIKNQLLEARKNKDEIRRNILMVLLGDIQTLEATKNSTMTKEEVEARVRKLVEGNQETINADALSARALILKKEVEILNEFLPRYATKSEVVYALKEEDIQAIKNMSEGQSIGYVVKLMKQLNIPVLGGTVKEAVAYLKSNGRRSNVLS